MNKNKNSRVNLICKELVQKLFPVVSSNWLEFKSLNVCLQKRLKNICNINNAHNIQCFLIDGSLGKKLNSTITKCQATEINCLTCCQLNVMVITGLGLRMNQPTNRQGKNNIYVPEVNTDEWTLVTTNCLHKAQYTPPTPTRGNCRVSSRFASAVCTWIRN